jgi:membrane associated rhomboid family serine protease
MSITLLIILLTSGISIYAWRSPALMSQWIMNPYRVSRNGEYYRLLTSGFLHADWQHLIFNMISLYFFGSNIEGLFTALYGATGPIVLVVIYLVAIVISDLPTFFQYKDQPGYNALGASGGVSALIFAAILADPLNKIYFYFIPIGIPGFLFGAGYLAYTYYESRRGNDNINHSAHLYGAVFGIVVLALLYPPIVPSFIEQIQTWRPF